MSQHLLAIAASNLVLAAVLALVAWAVQARARRPWLAHLIWLLVLVKLVTPPLVSAPVITIPVPSPIAATMPSSHEHAATVRPAVASTGETDARLGSAALQVDAAEEAATTMAPRAATTLLWLWLWLRLWLVGSAAVLGLSLVRIVRFERLLRSTSRPADARIEWMAASLSRRLGLRRVPDLRLVHANVAPLVWWVGGRVRIVLPASMADGLDPRALRLVVAHELAHVRRGDHMVRWVEWAASVLFWWCPILWVARRGLRRNEELCCDALVVERLSVSPNTYASSILDAIELMAAPALRPPVIASQMTSGGALEDRLTMIVSDRLFLSPSRWARLAALFVAGVVLPFGIARAQAPNYEAVSARLMTAVDSGELSESQAKAMFGALAVQHLEESLAARRASGEGEEHGGDMEPRVWRYQEEPRVWRYREIEREIRGAVERGEAPPEAGERRLIEVRRRMFPERREAEESQDIDAAAAEIEEMVKAGRVSREAANRRLEGMRRQFAPTSAGESEEAAMAEGIERRMTEAREAVGRGEISRDDYGRIVRELEGARRESRSEPGSRPELEGAIDHMKEEISSLGSLIRAGEASPGLIEMYRKGLLDQDVPQLERLGASEQLLARIRMAIENAGSDGVEAEEARERERPRRSGGRRTREREDAPQSSDGR